MATRLPGTTYKLNVTHQVGGINGPVRGDPSPDPLGTGFIGGNDVFQGGANVAGGYWAYGEGWDMNGTAVGGNDRFVGGVRSGVVETTVEDVIWDDWDDKVLFVGDAETMSSGAKGGADVIAGGNNTANVFIGDAGGVLESGGTFDSGGMFDSAMGGADNIRGGNALSTSTLSGGASNLIIGDADYISGAGGGNDVLTAGNATSATAQWSGVINAVYGDADEISGGGQGGRDNIVGGNAVVTSGTGSAEAINLLLGDAFEIDWASGGNDVIKGGNASVTRAGGESHVQNLMAGDSFSGYAIFGGNDTMVGGNASSVAGDSTSAGVENYMAGDTWASAGWLDDYGNDSMTGGSATGINSTVYNEMYGDVGDPWLAQWFLSGGFASGGSGIEIRGFSSGGPEFGNDMLTGGNESNGGSVSNTLVGDAYLIFGASGGNDVVKGGGIGSDNELVGDAFGMYYSAQGGGDTLTGGGTGSDNEIYGDAEYGDMASGGNDLMTGGGANSTNEMYGDFGSGFGVWGGNDTMTGGGTGSHNEIYGDADQFGSSAYDVPPVYSDDVDPILLVSGYTVSAVDGGYGGDDILKGGGTNSINVIFGDGGGVYVSADEGVWGVSAGIYVSGVTQSVFGGDDRLTAGAAGSKNYMFGDAGSMISGAGGDDTLVGTAGAYNEMYGDAYSISGGGGVVNTLPASGGGGDDMLTAGGAGSTNYMYGDAYMLEDAGGNDTLVGGVATDHMWGDAASGSGLGGDDTFVFKFGNGTDTIYDFDVSGGDMLDLSAMATKFDSWQDLIDQGRVQVDEDDVVLHLDSSNPFSSSNTVRLVGVDMDDLGEEDFLFSST